MVEEKYRCTREEGRRVVGHVKRREGMESSSLTGRVPSNGARGKQGEIYTDRIARTLGGGRKPGKLLEVARERESERGVAVHGRQRLEGHGTSADAYHTEPTVVACSQTKGKVC